MELLDPDGDHRLMARAGIWIFALVAVLASIYWIGRQDGIHLTDQQAIDSMDSLLDSQAEIDRENLKIINSHFVNQVEQVKVDEAIKREREKNKSVAVAHLSRGDVRLLNAARSNQWPDAIHPRLTDGEKRTASTVTEQSLIDADIQCSKKYNECASKRNALIDIVKVFQEKTNELICR